MKPSDKVIHGSTVYYSASATARLLGTTGKKVKEMMGRGDLEWTQFKPNGRLFISAASIAAYDKRQREKIEPRVMGRQKGATSPRRVSVK